MGKNKAISEVGFAVAPHFQGARKLWIVFKPYLVSLEQSFKYRDYFGLGILVSATKHPFALQYDQRCH